MDATKSLTQKECRSFSSVPRSSPRKITAELCWTMRFVLSAKLCISHLHHVARAASKVKVDMPVRISCAPS